MEIKDVFKHEKKEFKVWKLKMKEKYLNLNFNNIFYNLLFEVFLAFLYLGS